MKLRKHLFTALIISFMILSVSTQTVKKGSIAPDFSLKTSEGKALKLSDYKGKAVLLHFWATWCPPCSRKIWRYGENRRNLSPAASSAICEKQQKNPPNYVRRIEKCKKRLNLSPAKTI